MPAILPNVPLSGSCIVSKSEEMISGTSRTSVASSPRLKFVWMRGSMVFSIVLSSGMLRSLIWLKIACMTIRWRFMRPKSLSRARQRAYSMAVAPFRWFLPTPTAWSSSRMLISLTWFVAYG